MYKTQFNNLTLMSEWDIVITASFEHMLYDDTIRERFVFHSGDDSNDLSIKDMLIEWGAKHGYYLIKDSIKIEY